MHIDSKGRKLPALFKYSKYSKLQLCIRYKIFGSLDIVKRLLPIHSNHLDHGINPEPFFSAPAIYSAGQKISTLISWIFCDPPMGGGPTLKIIEYAELHHMISYRLKSPSTREAWLIDYQAKPSRSIFQINWELIEIDRWLIDTSKCQGLTGLGLVSFIRNNGKVGLLLKTWFCTICHPAKCDILPECVSIKWQTINHSGRGCPAAILILLFYPCQRSTCFSSSQKAFDIFSFPVFLKQNWLSICKMKVSHLTFFLRIWQQNMALKTQVPPWQGKKIRSKSLSETTPSQND